MAIRKMTGKEKAGQPNVEIVRDYRGAEEGLISHGKACPLYNKFDVSGKHSPECVRRSKEFGVDQHGNKRDYNDFCSEPPGPLYMETTHVGEVVEIGEVNGRDDSDFYAVVVKGDGFERVTYGTTRAWTYPNSAWVDAPPEVIARYHKWKQDMADAHAQALRKAQRACDRAMGGFDMGERVKVVRGRKVPIGTEGTVFWRGKNQYSDKPRIGIVTDTGDKHFTDGTNCESLSPSAG